MSVRIYIERLVLDGMTLSAAEGPVVKAAVEAELTRLVSEGALRPEVLAGGAIGRQAGEMRMVEGGTAREAGAGIARAVYGGIGR